MTTAAIYYHPEAYTTSGPKLMGRNAAGESFLRGFFTHSTTDSFWAQVQQAEHAQVFAQTARHFGRLERIHAVDKNTLTHLKQAEVIYYPGPGIGDHAKDRSAFGHHAWSLCGITHTTSSAGAMDAIVDLITSPVQPWDAVICTSQAVKDNVQRILQAQADYLKDRLGIQKLLLPQLPVIPLGIHTQDFIFSAEQKQQARKRIGADDKTHVVLFMGRLSFHAKAHPLAMYQALEESVKYLPADETICLVECGWFANDFIANAYREAQQLACPSISVVTLDGRNTEDRQTAWACADIFCSLSDNIQETFGIVPIEAMAAGLPVVVSDWDGYKDTVRDGIDGYRIPTLMPSAGLGQDLAQRHALNIDTYDMYCGHTCSLISVDVTQTAEAFSRLFASAELRQQMGQAGRERAIQIYDWANIIPQYERLWSELSSIRRAHQPQTASPINPARLDPFYAFANYPTHPMSTGTQLLMVDDSLTTALTRARAYRALAMINFANAVLPSEIEISALLTQASKGQQSASQLVQACIPMERQAFCLRALVWLVKLNLLKVST